VAERHRLERRLPGRRGELGPGGSARQRRLRVRVLHQHGRAQGRQLRPQRRDVRQDVELLAAVAVAVDGDQHRGLHLGEPLADRARAEVWRARRPDRAKAGGGEEADQRFRAVGQHGDDPIAPPHPGGDEPGPRPGDRVAQLRVGERPLHPVLAGEQHRDVAVRAAGTWGQRVLGVVEGRAGEPLCARHLPRTQHRRGPGGEPHAEELRRGPPELRGVRDRPAVQCRVVQRIPAHRPGKLRDPGALRDFRVRRVKNLGLLSFHPCSLSCHSRAPSRCVFRSGSRWWADFGK
jgi:hypothetical protein